MRRNFCFCMLMSLMLLGFSSTAVSQFGDPVPRYPQEMDGPVNMINRALYLSATDLAVPGRGLGIEFTRYYNSDGMHDGYYSSVYDPAYAGYKWSHSYQWSLRSTWSLTTSSYSLLAVVTGSGSKQEFTSSSRIPSPSQQNFWQNLSRITFSPQSGVRASLKVEQSGEMWAIIYTTRNGMRYKFEKPDGIIIKSPWLYDNFMLTEISGPNGNKLKLHYEAAPEPRGNRGPRLVAVEDTLGRILKFYYDLTIDDVAYPRCITKIEFGLGTPQALTTVYQTVTYSYARYRIDNNRPYQKNYLISVTHPLGSGDSRGTAVTAQYEYNRSSSSNYRHFGLLAAAVSPMGYRTEFDVYGDRDRGYDRGRVTRVRVRDVPPDDSTEGDVLYERQYGGPYTYNNLLRAYNRDPENRSRQRYDYGYHASSGYVSMLYHNHPYPTGYYSLSWSYSNRNLSYHSASLYKAPVSKRIRHYRIYYEGSNATHNQRMGNATKWEQIDPTRSSTVLRKWEADYETTYNRPIWQIDSMGHKVV